MNVLLIMMVISVHEMKHVKSNFVEKGINEEKALLQDIKKTMAELVAKIYFLELKETHKNFISKMSEEDKVEQCQIKHSPSAKALENYVTPLKPGEHKKFAYLIQDFFKSSEGPETLKVPETPEAEDENIDIISKKDAESIENTLRPVAEVLVPHLPFEAISNMFPAVRKPNPTVGKMKPLSDKRRVFKEDLFNLNKLLFWLHSKKHKISKEDVIKPSWIAYCPEGYTPLIGTQNCKRVKN